MLVNTHLHPHLIAQMHRIHKQGDMKLALSRHTHTHARSFLARAESARDVDGPAGLLAATLHSPLVA